MAMTDEKKTLRQNNSRFSDDNDNDVEGTSRK